MPKIGKTSIRIGEKHFEFVIHYSNRNSKFYIILAPEQIQGSEETEKMLVQIQPRGFNSSMRTLAAKSEEELEQNIKIYFDAWIKLVKTERKVILIKFHASKEHEHNGTETRGLSLTYTVMWEVNINNSLNYETRYEYEAFDEKRVSISSVHSLNKNSLIIAYTDEVEKLLKDVHSKLEVLGKLLEKHLSTEHSVLNALNNKLLSENFT